MMEWEHSSYGDQLCISVDEDVDSIATFIRQGVSSHDTSFEGHATPIPSFPTSAAGFAESSEFSVIEGDIDSVVTHASELPYKKKVRLLNGLNESVRIHMENALKRSQEIRDELHNARETYSTGSWKYIEIFPTSSYSAVGGPEGSFGVFYQPYFSSLFEGKQPENEDVLARRMNNLNIRNPSKPRYWFETEKDMLYKAVKEQAIKKIYEKYGCDGKIAEFKPEDRQEILRKRKAIENMADDELFSNRYENYDWWHISNNALFGWKSSIQCQQLWVNFMHPSLNTTEPWTMAEDDKLRDVIESTDMYNWECAAKMLKTKRPPLHCMMRYKRYLRVIDRIKRHWSVGEDAKLLSLVDKFSIGNYVNWQRVSSHMVNRSRTQCYMRHKCFLSHDRRFVPFRIEEDAVILAAVEALGDTNFGILSRLLPGRPGAQVRTRYQTYLNPEVIVTKWSEEEDFYLQHTVNKLSSEVDLDFTWTFVSKFLNKNYGMRRTPIAIRNRWGVLASLQERNYAQGTAKPSVSRNMTRREKWRQKAKEMAEYISPDAIHETLHYPKLQDMEFNAIYNLLTKGRCPRLGPDRKITKKYKSSFIEEEYKGRRGNYILGTTIKTDEDAVNLTKIMSTFGISCQFYNRHVMLQRMQNQEITQYFPRHEINFHINRVLPRKFKSKRKMPAIPVSFVSVVTLRQLLMFQRKFINTMLKYEDGSLTPEEKDQYTDEEWGHLKETYSGDMKDLENLYANSNPFDKIHVAAQDEHLTEKMDVRHFMVELLQLLRLPQLLLSCRNRQAKYMRYHETPVPLSWKTGQQKRYEKEEKERAQAAKLDVKNWSVELPDGSLMTAEGVTPKPSWHQMPPPKIRKPKKTSKSYAKDFRKRMDNAKANLRERQEAESETKNEYSPTKYIDVIPATEEMELELPS